LQSLAFAILLGLALASGAVVSGVFAAAPIGSSIFGENNKPQQAAGEPTKPLESLLNEDGTLNLKVGYSGSLDPTGWSMEIGLNGQPRFVQEGSEQSSKSLISPASISANSAFAPLVPGDENWDDRFAFNYLDNQVNAVAISGSDVYIGGLFTAIGVLTANRVAKWNGSSWSALGSGTDNAVYGIAISGSDVYICGGFITAGGVSTSRVAKWNGSS
jgi:trimeric autotransporter adhesin